MTDYLKKKLLDHCLGVASYTMPTTVYLALSTTNPTKTGSTAGEIVGNGYARQSITFSAATLGTGSTSNSSDVTFPIPTASWGTIAYIGIMDAATGGNMLWYGQLLDSQGTPITKTVTTSDQLKLSATKLSVSLG